MGFLIEKDIALVEKIAQRERAPMYVVGETTGDIQFVLNKPMGEKTYRLAFGLYDRQSSSYYYYRQYRYQ